DVGRIEGDIGRAAMLYRESLALSWGQKDRRRIAPALAGLAGVAAAWGQRDQAARLFGATAVLIEAIGVIALFPFAQEAHDAGITAVRTALSEAAFAAAYAAGRSMPLGEAVAEAAGFEAPPRAETDGPSRDDSADKVRLSPREIDA